MNVAIELQQEIARSLAGPHDDRSRVTLEALAAHGYRSGKLTHAEVQRLLGFNSRLRTTARRYSTSKREASTSSCLASSRMR